MLKKLGKNIGTLIIIVAVIAMGILSTSAASEKIIIGTSADWPPFEWIDANNNFVGFDMDLMKIIAKVQGYEIEIQDIGFDSLIPAL